MLKKLDETFRSYQPSERCWLDGDYIWTVWREYPGTIEEPLLLNLTPEHGKVYGMVRIERKPVPVLVRVKIDVVTEEGVNFKHSNLLVFDFSRREAYRFEPVDDHEFGDEINLLLQDYVKKVDNNLRYRELPQHPQPNIDQECPSKGMCVAYVLKAGVDIALGRDVEVLSGQEIKRFAQAVESLF
jgi:hypothetical protein